MKRGKKEKEGQREWKKKKKRARKMLWLNWRVGFGEMRRRKGH